MKISDRVRIIDAGQYYPRFDEMAVKLGATKYTPEEFDNDYRMLENKVGIIKNTSIKPRFGTILCLVDLGNSEIIISEKGLKVIEPIGIVKFMESINEKSKNK